jgi:hypothetical protein
MRRKAAMRFGVRTCSSYDDILVIVQCQRTGGYGDGGARRSQAPRKGGRVDSRRGNPERGGLTFGRQRERAA